MCSVGDHPPSPVALVDHAHAACCLLPVHVQIQAAAKRAEEKGVTTDEVATVVLEALTAPEPEAR